MSAARREEFRRRAVELARLLHFRGKAVESIPVLFERFRETRLRERFDTVQLALVQDQLCGAAGSERVFQYLCEEFPEADIYTVAYNPESTLPYFSSREIRTTWINRWIKNMEAFRWSFPISSAVMSHLDLSEYDVVLTSSATTAKYVKARPGAHICYCYIPTRALWHTEEYFGKSPKRLALKPFLNFLRKRDYRVAQSVDRFIAISETTRDYIKSYYDRDSEIVYCPIDTEMFHPTGNRGGHYLIVSRLEAWKKVDYAIEAFNRLGKPLKIVGTGAEEARLKRIAGPNIEFLGFLDDGQLAREYAECRAVIFTPFIEYGLIPLEANAAGAPVICYGRGGVEETMVPAVTSGAASPTAVFFYEQSAAALEQAIRQFEELTFDEKVLVKHASQWGIAAFKTKMRAIVNGHCSTARRG